MSTSASRDDFIKAAGYMYLQMDTSLKDAQRDVNASGLFSRAARRREFEPMMIYCRIITRTAEESGLGVVKDGVLAEAYCRSALGDAVHYLMNAMQALPSSEPAVQRLSGINALLMEGLCNFLTLATLQECMYGDQVEVVREIEADIHLMNGTRH